MAISSKKALDAAKVIVDFAMSKKDTKTLLFLGYMAQIIVLCVRLICKMF